jgi:hypothetical protein
VSVPAQDPASGQPTEGAPYAPPSSGVVPEADGAAGTTGAVAPIIEKLERPNLDPCPSCKIGLMYPITWDEEARHEQGQAIFAPAILSGGSALRSCFHCGYGDSVALNPSPAPAKPPWVD